MVRFFNFLFGFLILFQWYCGSQKQLPSPAPKTIEEAVIEIDTTAILVGADQTWLYLPKLYGKNVGLIVNHTSRIGSTHLVDSLLGAGIKVKKIFAPEHGFRGKADAGEKVKNGRDADTGIPIISLYGKQERPYKSDMNKLEVVVFDIQDVGARFYTYTLTMRHMMKVCARYGIPMIILDRPNPNGHFIDGPVLDPKFRSIVGKDPIPVVHGLTPGEYAKMINGEGWLGNGLKCDLAVITCENYDHKTPYDLPVKPSPNLPNMRSIYLYPSLCFLEGTDFNAGRGTDKQFQVYGHPSFTSGSYSYIPVPKPGAKYPKHEKMVCYGHDLSKTNTDSLWQSRALNIDYLIDTYNSFPKKREFFLANRFFDLLAGTNQLRYQIRDGKSAEAIRASWQEGLEHYQTIRKQYLLYPDFEN